MGSNDPLVSEHFLLDHPNGSASVFGYRGSEIFEVQATDFPATIHAGKNDDTIEIGSGGSLDDVLGLVTVFGQGGTDVMYVNDVSSAIARDYSLAPDSLNWNNANSSGTIVYNGGLENLQLEMTGHADEMQIFITPAKTQVALGGNAGQDLLIGPPTRKTSFSLDDLDQGRVNNTVSFTSFQDLSGGAKPDQFLLAAAGSLSGNIWGEGGVDTLDYSEWTVEVEVDLSTNFARGVAAVFDVENVIGGSADDQLIGDGERNELTGGPGNDELRGGGERDVLNGLEGDDVLLGEAGKDKLFGGPGNNVLVGGAEIDRVFGGPDRDVLIGGASKDRIWGGGGEDLLIAGTTIYDQQVPSLRNIASEWFRKDALYAQRIKHLREGTGLNTFTQLIASGVNPTVLDDAARDRLFGELNDDWFFARIEGSNTDKLPDYNNPEEIDPL